MAKQTVNIAKFTAPSVEEVFFRERLFCKLDEARKKQIIWLTGPAGSGKTSLVSSYLKARGLSCLWYQIDGGDNDLATFFYYLGLAGKKAAPRKSRPLPVLTSEYLMGVPEFSRNFFSELYSRLNPPAVLVFDNYQEVQEEAPLHGSIIEGLARIPDGLTCILVSRTNPLSPYLRLKANRQMAVIGWQDLRFTVDEFRQIASSYSDTEPSVDVVSQLHERTDGWIAGFLLMLESRDFSWQEASAYYSQDEIFRYFAEELFDQLPEKSRAFLLKTSCLSAMNIQMAEDISGISTAGRILSSLHRNNLFISRIRHPQAIYQYHPLFREFLLSKADEKLGKEKWAEIRRTAAELLEKAGQPEDAAAFFIEEGEWQRLVPLILEQAPSLAGQGRYGLLKEWLKSLPERVYAEIPWLTYWQGACRMPFDIRAAREDFERAFSSFQAARDAVGLCMAWSGVTDSHLYDFHGWGNRSLAKWILKMEKLMADGLSFPSKEVEARVTFSMFQALIAIEPWHEKISPWADRLKAFLKASPDRSFQITAGSYLGVYYAWVGDMQELSHLFETVRLIFRSSSISPLARLLWLHCDAIYRWNVDDPSACLQLVAQAEEIARSTGIHVLDIQILTDGVYGSLIAGDTGTAYQYLKKMYSSLQPHNVLDFSHYHYLKGWRETLVGEVNKATEDLEIAVQTLPEDGAPFPVANQLISLAALLLKRGEFERAESLLDKAGPIGQKMRSAILEARYLLARASLAFKRGREKQGLTSLRRAFGLMKQHGIKTLTFWLPGAMADLCVKALEADIESDYVRGLIRKRGLQPKSPPLHIENWPWKLRVHTLGRFSAVFDEKPLTIKGGKGGKPLDLLKLLIALGGREISEERVAHTLWPDADGDAARRALTTTLHRLRQMVGADTVILKDGRLTLNSGYFWVDAWAFERLVAEIDATGKDTTQESLGAMEAASRLYKGSFLSGELYEPWIADVRERLRSKFVRIALKLGRYWEGENRFDRAVECYQKGLEVDLLVEKFYERLMECYQRLGLKTEAIATFNRCKKNLARHLGIGPSERVKNKYRKI